MDKKVKFNQLDKIDISNQNQNPNFPKSINNPKDNLSNRNRRQDKSNNHHEQNKNPNFPKSINNPKDNLFHRNRRQDKSNNYDQNLSVQNDHFKTNANNKTKVSFKGYRYLESLLSKEATDLVAIIAHSKSGFLDILRQNPIRTDWIILIINLLARLTETSFINLRVPILTGSCEPNFLSQLNINIGKLPSLKKDEKEILQFIDNILKYCLLIFETLPHQITKFEDILIALDLNIEGIKKYKGINLTEEMNITFSRLQQQYSDVKKVSNYI